MIITAVVLYARDMLNLIFTGSTLCITKLMPTVANIRITTVFLFLDLAGAPFIVVSAGNSFKLLPGFYVLIRDRSSCIFAQISIPNSVSKMHPFIQLRSVDLCFPSCPATFSFPSHVVFLTISKWKKSSVEPESSL